MRISLREAKSQLSNTSDILLTASRGEKPNRTRDETAELITSRGFFLRSFLKCAAGLRGKHHPCHDQNNDDNYAKTPMSSNDSIHTNAELGLHILNDTP